ncbi:hypothetical protein Q5P01_000328 [Channa striata]|uniref:Uncharacterized protein n=1 Tax=Channa striata TaxID=64152 RepID=A0AA88LEX6_CHASR|nr:hypothetical protein Q5P01_000328 [Channa striata]
MARLTSAPARPVSRRRRDARRRTSSRGRRHEIRRKLITAIAVLTVTLVLAALIVAGALCGADRLLLIYCESTISVYTFPLGYSVASQGRAPVERSVERSVALARRCRSRRRRINAKWAAPWFRLTNPALRYAKPWRSSADPKADRRISGHLGLRVRGEVEVGGYYSSFECSPPATRAPKRAWAALLALQRGGANFKVEGLARGQRGREHGPIDDAGGSDSERKALASISRESRRVQIGGQSRRRVDWENALKMNPYPLRIASSLDQISAGNLVKQFNQGLPRVDSSPARISSPRLSSNPARRGFATSGNRSPFPFPFARNHLNMPNSSRLSSSRYARISVTDMSLGRSPVDLALLAARLTSLSSRPVHSPASRPRRAHDHTGDTEVHPACSARDSSLSRSPRAQLRHAVPSGFHLAQASMKAAETALPSLWRDPPTPGLVGGRVYAMASSSSWLIIPSQRARARRNASGGV